MNYDEFTESVEDAKRIVNRGDMAVQQLAKMAVGRLRISGVSHYVLKGLKRELRGFNINTAKWRDE